MIGNELRQSPSSAAPSFSTEALAAFCAAFALLFAFLAAEPAHSQQCTPQVQRLYLNRFPTGDR
jgi:hypothetical protein